MEELNDLNKIIKDDVLIEALYLDDKVPEDVKQLIKPAAIQRDWMSQEDQKYSYHCIPLTHANQLGYWLLNNNDATIHWDGGKNIQDVKITLDNPDVQKLISSHFPIGIITFSFPFLFKEEHFTDFNPNKDNLGNNTTFNNCTRVEIRSMNTPCV